MTPADLSDALLDELLGHARAVALACARLVVDERPRDLGVDTKSTPTDVVTLMDRRSEELARRELRARRPADGSLGEEGLDAVGSSGITWVVDPIDGTVNYLYDLPGWAVSVAAEAGGETVVGVVTVPRFGETFSAVRGRGATRNGVPIHVSGCRELSQAMVATGFGYAAARRARQAAVLATVLPQVRDIRRFGAASVDLCSVACGRVDGYYERGLQPWDLAAGGLVAREAGARVTGLAGAPAGADLVLAAGPGLHAALDALLTPLGPDHD